MSIVLSPLNERYRLSAVKVTMGAELPAMDDAAVIDFLLFGVMKPMVYDIVTDPADLGVGRDGNYIINYVFADIDVDSSIYNFLSITAASVVNKIIPFILNIMLILLLLKLSNA